MHGKRNAMVLIDLNHLFADDDTCQRLHNVLHHSPTPYRDRSLARVIDNAGLLLLFVPLFAQVLVPDAQVIRQDDSFLVVVHAVVLAEHFGAVLERAVHHVLKHLVSLCPKLDDLVVLFAVHTHDALGLVLINLHADGLRCCECVLEFYSASAVAQTQNTSLANEPLLSIFLGDGAPVHRSSKQRVNIFSVCKLFDHIVLTRKPCDHTRFDLR